jgi:hypothetical protein
MNHRMFQNMLYKFSFQNIKENDDDDDLAKGAGYK